MKDTFIKYIRYESIDVQYTMHKSKHQIYMHFKFKFMQIYTLKNGKVCKKSIMQAILFSVVLTKNLYFSIFYIFWMFEYVSE